MNDQRTEHLKLPLPCNSLDIDLPRIQQAFIELDQKIAALDILLSSDDITLDTLQELVAAIKAARTDVGSINTLVDAAIGLKVAISDIVNSLTDASTDKPLSAAQGKELNERKQALLVSGENIKTVGGASLLGEGDISVGLSVVVVTETTQAATAGYHYVLTNPADTLVRLPEEPSSGDTVAITVANGLFSNVIDPGANTVMEAPGAMLIDRICTVTLRFLNLSWRLV